MPYPTYVRLAIGFFDEGGKKDPESFKRSKNANVLTVARNRRGWRQTFTFLGR